MLDKEKVREFIENRLSRGERVRSKDLFQHLNSYKAKFDKENGPQILADLGYVTVSGRYGGIYKKDSISTAIVKSKIKAPKASDLVELLEKDLPKSKDSVLLNLFDAGNDAERIVSNMTRSVVEITDPSLQMDLIKLSCDLKNQIANFTSQLINLSKKGQVPNENDVQCSRNGSKGFPNLLGKGAPN